MYIDESTSINVRNLYLRNNLSTTNYSTTSEWYDDIEKSSKIFIGTSINHITKSRVYLYNKYILEYFVNTIWYKLF